MDERRRFEAMYEEHRKGLLAYAVRRVGPEDAPDVVAEAFLVAWRRLADVPDDPLPWLFGVARRVIATNRRGHRRRARLAERLAQAVPLGASDAAPGRPDTGELGRAFASLGEPDREVLTLVALDGLSVARAAAALGCSPPALSVRLHRARSRLAKRMTSGTAPRLARLEESR
jgi:RNA polymerase sigma-70 factor (ECF subfamily)